MSIFNRLPLAAIYFYVAAGLVGLLGIGTMGFGLLGAAFSSRANDPLHVGTLMGGSFLMVGFSQLIVAGGLAAIGAVVHDIRRIAENTSAIAAHRGNAGFSLPSYSTGTPKVEAVFFYFEKSVEHGPLSRSELAALIRSNHVSPFQRIEKSVGGVRQPFESRDLEP
jgi:hypothetical protein